MMNIELYWTAKYIDGSEFKQFNNGKENKYTDIDRERLCQFIMKEVGTDKSVYSLYIREGQHLIYRRRTLKRFGKSDTVVFLVGYKITFMANSGPREQIVMNYLFPDGSVALDGVRGNLKLIPEV